MHDRLATALGGVNWQLAAAVSVFAFLIVLSLPRRLRLPVMLAALPAWLLLGILPGLGVVCAIAKATSMPALALGAYAALTYPGPLRRRLPAQALLYPWVTVLSFLFIQNVEDRLYANLVNVSCLGLVVCALLVTRTVTDEQSFHRVLKSTAVGLAACIVLLAVALAVSPRESFFATGEGGRLAVMSGKTNMLSTYLLTSVPLAFFYGTVSGKGVQRIAWLSISSIGFGLALLTGSRSIVYLLAPLLFLWLLANLTRPLTFFLALSIMPIAVGWALSHSTNLRVLDRLMSAETRRDEIARTYINLALERPLSGLMFSRGESWWRARESDHSTANAYIQYLWTGGLPLFLLGTGLAVYTLSCSWVVFMNRKLMAIEPRVVILSCTLMALIYAYGFASAAIIHGTQFIAFFHYLLSMLIITMRHDLRLRPRVPSQFDFSRQPIGNGDRRPLDRGYQPAHLRGGPATL